MIKRKSITICIPLFNEEEVIEQLSKNLTNLNSNIQHIADTEFLLVDDGSQDNTYNKLNEYFSNKSNFNIVQHKKNLNLDGFLKTSIEWSSTDYITFLDSDSTFDPQLIIPMLEIINQGFDIVNGSHLHPNGSTVGVTFFRKQISIVANTIYRLILNKKIYTFTSILKMYKLTKIKNIDIEYKGFVAVTELLIKCLLEGNKFYDFPCTLSTRNKGESKINYAATITTHLKFMLFVAKQRLSNR